VQAVWPLPMELRQPAPLARTQARYPQRPAWYRLPTRNPVSV